MKNANIKKQADQVEQSCVGYSLRQLDRVITNIYNSEFAAIGITSSQFNIFTAIAKMQPVSPAKVAKVMQLEKSSLSRNLEIMRRNGWLLTEGNSRAMQLSLTEKGEDIYGRAFPYWEKAQKRSQEIIGEEAAKNLQMAVRSMPAH